MLKWMAKSFDLKTVLYDVLEVTFLNYWLFKVKSNK